MKTQESFLVEVDKLIDKPYNEVLCYPRPDKAEAKRRVVELKKLGVKALEFAGEKNISGIPVLGKGCVGVVVIARLRNEEKVALKIRRVDADRADMRHEAEMLQKANSVGVGPKLVRNTDNFLLMQYIEDDLLPKWLEKTEDKNLIKKVLRELLLQCFKLDQIGLDHGELSNAPKHLIMDKEANPYILDFETASIERKTANVTSLVQYLFIKSPVADIIREKIGKVNEQRLIEVLRKYKRSKTRENFEKVLNMCGLV